MAFNLDLFFAIIFYSLIIIFFLKNKEKFQVQNKIFVIYRTKLGIKLMDKISKFCPRLLNFISYISIFIGFLGMLFIFYILIKGTLSLLFIPNAQPALAPVLPGVKVPGLPNLSFWHWIITIFFVAVVHEFSHGVFARLNNLKLKSSGFAFLGPILAAFVEPDEKQLSKASKKTQLSVLSAGPFSNILLGLIFLLIMNFLIAPIQLQVIEPTGVQVHNLISGYPAEKIGIETPFILEKINDDEIIDLVTFLNATDKVKPNQEIILTTDKGEYSLTTVENPEDSSKGFIGISTFELKTKIKDNVNKIYAKIVLWVALLIFWIFVVNLGIGLFNLLPIGPVDGGKMFFVLSSIIFKKEDKAKKLWSFISLFCLALIIINLIPYISKLLVFLFKSVLLLLTLFGF